MARSREGLALGEICMLRRQPPASARVQGRVGRRFGAKSARELTFVRFALYESRLHRSIGQDHYRPDMGHGSDQKRPLLRCPYLRDMNRGLKTSNDQNHEKGFHRFICHISTGISGVPCFRKLPGPGCVFVVDQSFGKNISIVRTA
jgi:hypothetical protein